MGIHFGISKTTQNVCGYLNVTPDILDNCEQNVVKITKNENTITFEVPGSLKCEPILDQNTQFKSVNKKSKNVVLQNLKNFEKLIQINAEI